jgi:maltose/maltodextrin transport system permease protein
MLSNKTQWFLRAAGVSMLALGFWLVWLVSRAGHPWMALGGVVTLGASGWVFVSPRAYAWRYLYPGVAAVLVFVVFPALYTVGIGFTNYSSSHLLSYERATAYLLDQTYSGGSAPLALEVFPAAGKYRLQLSDDSGKVWTTDALALNVTEARTLVLQPATASGGTPATLRELIALQSGLKSIVLRRPDSPVLYRQTGLREFSEASPLYTRRADGSLHNNQSGETVHPDFVAGVYRSASGEAMEPGFSVNVGWDNFKALFTHPEFQAPLWRIFAWTVLFAALSVLFTFCLGFVLATLLSWEALRGRTLYRVLLFLPYAVPGFISILIFRGLFNENFGEINMVLHSLFGLRPSWFSDPLLAKIMLLLVNTWLGYPYMMLLCMGLIKAIPADLYEVAAIHGAGAWTKLTRITLPLIMKPVMPLLLASFAFNFNNFVLISLLTDGRPDFTDSLVPAGTTDILVSYTYRVAFQDSGQNFGLAAAISTVIFLLVAILSLINLRLTRVNASAAR